jgi:hypothetical protein
MLPLIASRHRDSTGKPPQYTFFYPEDEYSPDVLSMIAELTSAGLAEVEVHLHHDGETGQRFLDRMRRYLEALYLRHGLLREYEGRIAFGFIHGNWALDNSRPDGRWCGLNNEILLLRKLGCYADFTLPSAPNPTQTRMVNTLYWATDDPTRPKSHDSGTPVTASGSSGDLMMIPGPLGLNRRGSRRLMPRLETGELASHDPAVKGRAASWLRLAPRLGDHVFLKLFTHGAQEQNAQHLLNGGLECCFEDLRDECARQGCRLHFVTAWEMYLAIVAQIRGAECEPRSHSEYKHQTRMTRQS